MLNDGARLAMLHWHIDRYDRLRGSTSARASVVLSAAALLSAGNAVVLTQVFAATFAWQWMRIIVAVLSLTNVALLVACVIKASGALVTLRGHKELFAGSGLLDAPVYSASDSVRLFPTFHDFDGHVHATNEADALRAASAELWIDIRQHRLRYKRLRDAVGLMRASACVFFLVTVAVVAFRIAS